MKHFTSRTLLCTILVSLLTSCGESVTPSENSSDISVTTEPTIIYPDYGGDEFNILMRTDWEYEFNVNQENGDLVNDAVYKRNRIVEDNYNIVLNSIAIAGGWDDRTQFINTINASILADEDAYDVVAGYQAYMITPAMEGMFMNVHDIAELQLSEPWWSKLAVDALTQNGKCFMITGDIALSQWSGLYCMYFNKGMAENYKINNLYEIVKDGKWTMDKLTELSALVSSDLNGDSNMDENDLYGLVTHTDRARNFIVSFETPVTTIGSDGFNELTFNSERSIEAAEKITKLFTAPSTFTKNADVRNIFRQGNALFFFESLSFALGNRDMEADFGILPMPKYDDNQETYLTSTHNSCSMMCFPISVSDPSYSGTIVDALCRESYETVVPVYYDKALKTKSARDDESQEMIDIIRTGLTFDFGWVHSVEMQSIGTTYEIICHGTQNFASQYASIEAGAKAGLEKINAAYKD